VQQLNASRATNIMAVVSLTPVACVPNARTKIQLSCCFQIIAWQVREAFEPWSFFVIQAPKPALAHMFLPQPRGEYVVRFAITAHERPTRTTGSSMGSMHADLWHKAGILRPDLMSALGT